jgi:hypothetical protein
MELIQVPEGFLPDNHGKIRSTKRAFDLAFKIATIDRYEDHESVANISKAIGISRGIIYKWIKEKDKIRESNLVSSRNDTPIYRVRVSTFEQVSGFLGVCLSNNWSLTSKQLQSKCMEFCDETGIRDFKASLKFLAKARRRYFDSLFPELFIAPSHLRSHRKNGATLAGDGLFSRKAYKWGHIICHFIGDKLREKDYLDNVAKGKTLTGYAIRITYNKVQLEDGTKDYFVIDCYHHMVRRECFASKANSPSGPAKWLRNGCKATTNSHIEILNGFHYKSDVVHNIIVNLNAGRKPMDDEHDDHFQKYKQKFLLKSGTEICFDYGNEYEFVQYVRPDAAAHEFTIPVCDEPNL